MSEDKQPSIIIDDRLRHRATPQQQLPEPSSSSSSSPPPRQQQQQQQPRKNLQDRFSLTRNETPMHESLGNMPTTTKQIKDKMSNQKSQKSCNKQDNNNNNNIINRISALFLHQRALCCSLPIWVLVLVASLDNADKQLLASSFGVLEKSLGLHVETLGYFSLFTNLSYALSLPFWGYLVHVYGMSKIHYLLSIACMCWGMTTCGIAMFGNSVMAQAIFRALNGFALGSILPLSQTLLVELVDVKLRGRAFGMMGLCEKLAGTIAAASVVYYDTLWRRPYYVLGVFSILMGGIAVQELHPRRRAMANIKTTTTRQRKDSNNNNNDNKAKEKNSDNNDGLLLLEKKDAENKNTNNNNDDDVQLTLRQIIQRITQLPAFICLVAQGIFGGTPWDIMSFLLLLMDWRGFTKEQIVSIQFTSGLSATLGGWLGGMLGDYAHAYAGGTKGRIGLALVSVVGGIPLYGLYIYATDYRWALLWSNLFHVWATWTPPGALRPICADLTRNPSERAQIVSLWIVLEKASGAIFGAPLVGYLTSTMLTKEEMNTTGVSEGKAQALAFNVFLLSALFWSICAFFWVAMAVTLPKNNSRRPNVVDGAKKTELNVLV